MMARVTTVLLGLSLLATATVSAQDRPIRLLLASSKVVVATDAAWHIRLLRVTIPAGQFLTYTGPQGMVYSTSAGVTVSVDGNRRTLQEGDGVFVTAARSTTFAAGQNASGVLLHYLLVTEAELNGIFYSRPAAAVELYRTPSPIPDLKAGPHEFTLTRVTVNPKVPPPPMHHRSGVALYYVLGGTWRLHMEGRDEPRGRGAIQLEPSTFVHTWENVGETPGALLQANLSPESVPEIIFIKRP
jgi:mannose-6-phosphate isomerase-like protein (cupin superfamily)